MRGSKITAQTVNISEIDTGFTSLMVNRMKMNKVQARIMTDIHMYYLVLAEQSFGSPDLIQDSDQDGTV